MKKSDEIAKLVEAINRSHTVLVASHIHPDGDATGSTLAIGLGLEKLGKKVVFYNRDETAFNVSFLPGSDQIVHSVPNDPIDLTIVLDCAEPRRIGDSFPEHGWGETIAVVDHHKTWDADFADIYVRDVDAAATGELVFDVLKAAGVEIDLDIAKCIYTTLVTDTGSFRYSNTTRKTFELAGTFVDLGVDPWEITCNVYESQPLARVQMLPKVLDTLSLSACGRVAFLTIDKEVVAQTGGDESLLDGFINHARAIRGVEVAVQLLADESEWRVSFRSRGAVDVSEIAKSHGGGGHRNAAGCVMTGELSKIRADLTDTFLALL